MANESASGTRTFGSVDWARIEHVLRSLDCRDVSSGCGRDCDALVDQLALRSVLASRRTAERDLVSFRNLASFLGSRIAEFRARSLDARPAHIIPVTVWMPEWFLVLSPEQVRDLGRTLSGVSYHGLKAIGARVIERHIEGRPSSVFHGSDVKALMILAGLPENAPFPTCRIRIKDAWTPITRRHLDLLLDALPPGSESTGFRVVINTGKCHPGLTRLLARAVWLTGMRSIELFTCRLHWPSSTRRDAVSAALPADGQGCSGNEDIRGHGNGMVTDKGIEASMRELERRYDKEIPQLEIRNAKTGCRRGLIDNPVRIQHLSSIGNEDLQVVWMVAQLYRAGFTTARMRSIRDFCTRMLGQASGQVFPKREHRITLHLLRHAFIDSCRRSMPLAAVAALAGHTLASSTKHYGGKHARYSRGRASDRWMPKPDPGEVKLVMDAWSGKVQEHDFTPVDDLQPECAPS